MEMKHVIIFAVIGIVALLGFNVINGNSHEKKREMVTSSTASDTNDAPSPSTDIASKPLSQQPKAIIDDATNKIDQAQKYEQDRLEQMGDTQ